MVEMLISMEAVAEGLGDTLVMAVKVQTAGRLASMALQVQAGALAAGVLIQAGLPLVVVA